jgi:hypothetical protein
MEHGYLISQAIKRKRNGIGTNEEIVQAIIAGGGAEDAARAAVAQLQAGDLTDTQVLNAFGY